MFDPFVDSQGRPRVVRGVTINTNAPKLAELAGIIGFETVWIDIEHGTVSFTEVEGLCMAAKSGGAVPTVRIADNERHHVLRTVEAGGEIVVVPMINHADAARQIVEHGKFPPLGHRGFNMRSRGLRYGLDPPAVSFEKANAATHLFAQIETLEAVENIGSICQVEGLAGIFIGPGDLSASMGKPGAFSDPQLIKTVQDVVTVARSAGKHAGILTAPGPLLDAALSAGSDLVFVSSDITELAKAWRGLLESLSN